MPFSLHRGWRLDMFSILVAAWLGVTLLVKWPHHNASRPTTEVQTALEQVLPRLFPALDGLRVAHHWAGLMAFTPDYLPIADRVPGTASMWVVGGFCGHGMPFGLRLGQLLAEAATHDVAPTALTPFRLQCDTLVEHGPPFATIREDIRQERGAMAG